MHLNAEQQQAVEEDGHCLVVACPGSGKTSVITQKISALISRYPASRICAVTFTRDAAAELKRRVASLVGDAVANRRCRIGTFHSLAIKQLRASGQIGKVISPAEQRAYLFRAMNHVDPQMTYEQAAAIIEKAKTTFSDCEEKESALYQTYAEMLSRNKVEDLYDVLRRSVQLMQSGDLPPLPVEYMLVDEFQDTDHIQLAWVMCHVKSGAFVTAVGDDDQSIYGWRGALGYPGMADFAARAPAKIINLSTNYRCRKEILDVADLLISKNEARVPKALFANRSVGGRVVTERYGSRENEAEAVITEALKQATPLKDPNGLFSYSVEGGVWAVLSRNRFLLDGVELALQEAGLTYFRSAGESMWSRQPFVSMLALMRSVQSGDTDGVDLALNHGISFKVGKAIAKATLDELHKALGSDFSQILDGGEMPYDQLDSEAASVVKTFVACAKGWRNNVRNGRYATTCRGIASWFAKFEDGEDRKELVTKMGEIAAKLSGTLIRRANTLTMQMPDNEQATPRGVHLYTMHGAKGLEFNNVWIVGADTETIPSPKSVDYAEERRLMYVAMTRAKDNLYLSSAISSKPSPFLADAGL